MNTVIVREILETDQSSLGAETPDVALLWESTPVERISYGGKEDIDGFATSSGILDYSLFTRPSIQNPERWQINGHAVLTGLPSRSGLFRFLARRRPRSTVYEMFTGETFASAEEAMGAAESWLRQVLRGDPPRGDILVTALD